MSECKSKLNLTNLFGDGKRREPKRSVAKDSALCAARPLNSFHMQTPIKHFLYDCNFYLGETDFSARFYCDNEQKILEFAHQMAKELRFYRLTVPNFIKLFEKLLKDSDKCLDMFFESHRDSGDLPL